MLTTEKVPPAVALGELKAFLRIEDSAEDALLAGLLRAATETVEAMLGLLLFERDVEERGVVRNGKLALTAEPAALFARSFLMYVSATYPRSVPMTGKRLRYASGMVLISSMAPLSVVKGLEISLHITSTPNAKA